MKKCFKCKGRITVTDSMISFYDVSSPEKNENEYNFCSEACLDGFFKDRMRFRAIVRELEEDM